MEVINSNLLIDCGFLCIYRKFKYETDFYLRSISLTLHKNFTLHKQIYNPFIRYWRR